MTKDGTKSPSLDVVSEAAQADRSERRRVPRLSLTTEQFRLSANGKIFSVVDLSDTGMALRILDSSDLALFPIGAVVKGALNLRREKYTVGAKVRRLGRDLVGCEFESLPEPSQRAIAEFLNPEALGRDLKPIPSSETGSVWYQGPSGTYLRFWRTTEGQCSRFLLLILGSFVQWEADTGVSTGSAQSSLEPGETRGVIRFETQLMSPDSEPDPGKLSIAKTMILSSNLPEDLKAWCTSQLRIDSTH